MGVNTSIPLLSVSGFHAGYGQQYILKDLSFSLQTGTLTALIGANGSGKSTLLKGLCHLIPSAGSWTLHMPLHDTVSDIPLSQLKTRQLASYISYLPQTNDLPLSLSALDMVLMGFEPSLSLLQSPGATHRLLAHNVLVSVGMASKEHCNFQTLSVGQKQLVLLARSLVLDTPLCFFDEPDSALDFVNRHRMLHMLKDMVHQHQKAGLLILHDPNVALDCCDQLLLLKDGHLCAPLYPSTDSEEKMSDAFSELYGAVHVFKKDGHCFLYPANV